MLRGSVRSIGRSLALLRILNSLVSPVLSCIRYFCDVPGIATSVNQDINDSLALFPLILAQAVDISHSLVQACVSLSLLHTIDLYTLLVQQHIQNFVGTILGTDVQGTAAQGVSRRVEEVGKFVGRLEVGQDCGKEIGVVAAACFEQKFAG